MSENNPAPPTAEPTAKPRNPVERLLVRGFIGVMLVVVAVETYSWWSQKSAMKTLLQKIRAVDEAPNSPAVTAADVKKAVGSRAPSRIEDLKGKRSSSGASRLEVYSWYSVSPFKKRELYVYYGARGVNEDGEPEVLAVQPDANDVISSAASQKTPE